MSIETFAWLAALALVVPVAIFVGVVVLLVCIGKMAAGERLSWPWGRRDG